MIGAASPILDKNNGQKPNNNFYFIHRRLKLSCSEKTIGSTTPDISQVSTIHMNSYIVIHIQGCRSRKAPPTPDFVRSINPISRREPYDHITACPHPPPTFQIFLRPLHHTVVGLSTRPTILIISKFSRFRVLWS